MVCEFGDYTVRSYRNCSYSNDNLYRNLGRSLVAGAAFGTGVALSSALCGGYYNPAPLLGDYYNPIAYTTPYYGGFGAYSNPFMGAYCNALITPTNYGSSFYADLDSPRGVRSVSPFVDAAINAPLSFSGTIGSFMIGGYI